jgi:hypothetical protein
VPEYGDPQNLNRYSYVLNNPVRYTDPTGHAVAVENDGGCWICSQTPSSGSTGGGSQEGNTSPRDDGGPTFEDPPVPPVVIVPLVDIGPIIISPSSPLEGEPTYCIAFKNRYKTLFAQFQNIQNEMDELKKQLANTKDDATKRLLQLRLNYLRMQLADLADAAGCSLQ